MRPGTDDPTGWTVSPRFSEVRSPDRSRMRQAVALACKLMLSLIAVAASAAFFAGQIDEGPLGGVQTVSPGGAHRPIEAVTFSPDGQLLASCGLDGVVRLWDVAKLRDGGGGEPELLHHDTERLALAFLPIPRLW